MSSSESPARYEVLLSSKDGIWLIEATRLKGVRSFGKTVVEAANNIREALAASEDLDNWDDLVLDYTFGDASASDAVKRFREAAIAEKEASVERAEALACVIESLRARGMSYRDIGAVVGLSHQRVAQLGASYSDAWQEWDQSGEAEVWDESAPDGLT